MKPLGHLEDVRRDDIGDPHSWLLGLSNAHTAAVHSTV